MSDQTKFVYKAGDYVVVRERYATTKSLIFDECYSIGAVIAVTNFNSLYVKLYHPNQREVWTHACNLRPAAQDEIALATMSVLAHMGE